MSNISEIYLIGREVIVNNEHYECKGGPKMFDEGVVVQSPSTNPPTDHVAVKFDRYIKHIHRRYLSVKSKTECSNQS